MKIEFAFEIEEKKPTFGSIPVGSIFKDDEDFGTAVYMKIRRAIIPEEDIFMALNLYTGEMVNFTFDEEVIPYKQVNDILFERGR